MGRARRDTRVKAVTIQTQTTTHERPGPELCGKGSAGRCAGGPEVRIKRYRGPYRVNQWPGGYEELGARMGPPPF